MDQPETPELDKLATISTTSQVQGEFLDWLQLTKGIKLCTWSEDLEEYFPIHVPLQDLLAEYHGIDLTKTEAEKRALLEYVRFKNQQGDYKHDPVTSWPQPQPDGTPACGNCGMPKCPACD